MRERLELLRAQKPGLRGVSREVHTPREEIRDSQPGPSNSFPEAKEDWVALVEGYWQRSFLVPWDTLAFPHLQACGLDIPRLLLDRIPQGVVALDTETTGLSGGAGTVAFLTGWAQPSPQGVVVNQHFMEDYPYEPEYLQGIFTSLGEAQLLLTYNGASFDLPLLRTRAIVNGLNFPLVHHRDVLYPARRLWKPILGSCRLQNLELGLWGFTRQGDIPGAEVPGRYFSSLKGGLGPRDPGLLQVFAHHAMDVTHLLVLDSILEVLLDPSNPQGRIKPYISFEKPEFIKPVALVEGNDILVCARRWTLNQVRNGEVHAPLELLYKLCRDFSEAHGSQARSLHFYRSLQTLFILARRAKLISMGLWAAQILWEHWNNASVHGFLRKYGGKNHP